MASNDSLDNRVAELVALSRKTTGGDQIKDVLNKIIDLYEEPETKDDEALEKLRQAFLLALRNFPGVLAEERFSNFLGEHINPADFGVLAWRMPTTVVSYFESLYSFKHEDESTAEYIRKHLSEVVVYALKQFEKKGDFGKMFELFQLAPISLDMADGELMRLRNRAYIYEMKRVRRNRGFLYGYLAVQAFLILFAFPLLFIYAENGEIRDRIESVAKVELPEEQRRYFSYRDGLYWSIITAGSIGYGDITPRTSIGRTIAAILGIMGVTTAGVIAGLILRWITPRRLDL